MDDKKDLLRYFSQLFDAALPVGELNQRAEIEKWNQRAAVWSRQIANGFPEKSKDRVDFVVDLLKEHHVINHQSKVLDIGCGLGLFSIAFAELADSVLGIDIADQMIEQAEKIADKKQVNNVKFKVSDFQTLNRKELGTDTEFDLVFTSLSPAAQSVSGLEKMISLSRDFCCDISFIERTNHLHQQVRADLFSDLPVEADADLNHYYLLFNILLLKNYLPRIFYYARKQSQNIEIDDEYITYVMKSILPNERQTESNYRMIRNWFEQRYDLQKPVSEKIESTYAIILWKVNQGIC